MNVDRVETRATTKRGLIRGAATALRNSFSSLLSAEEKPTGDPEVKSDKLTRRGFLGVAASAAALIALEPTVAKAEGLLNSGGVGTQPPDGAPDVPESGGAPAVAQAPATPGPNDEGPRPPETSEEIDVKPSGVFSPAIAAGPEGAPVQAPNVREFFLNRTVKEEDSSLPPYSEEERAEPMKFLQGTVDAMYNSKNPRLIEYADLFVNRENKHNYRDEGIPNGRWVIHALYLDEQTELNQKPIYFATVGAPFDYPEHFTVGVGLRSQRMLFGETASEEKKYPPNSSAAVLSLVFTEAVNTNLAQKVARMLKSPNAQIRRSPQDIQEYLMNSNPDIGEAYIFALNTTMQVYEEAKLDMDKAGITPSPITQDLYPKWKVTNEMPESDSKQRVLSILSSNYAKGLY